MERELWVVHSGPNKLCANGHVDENAAGGGFCGSVSCTMAELTSVGIFGMTNGLIQGRIGLLAARGLVGEISEESERNRAAYGMPPEAWQGARSQSMGCFAV